MTTAERPGAAPSRTEGPLVLAIDQGTSATKAVLVDATGAIVARGSTPLAQAHPRPGWAEQDAEEIWVSVQTSAATCLQNVEPGRVVAVGLSTQRESMVLWERASGHAVSPLLGWQDGRGAPLCAQLRDGGYGDRVRAVSGLPLDPMFSSTKATWLLDTYDSDRSRSSRGELCLGTVDSWLLARLGGDHVVEAGNASRTQLLDLSTRQWDPWLLDLFRVPVEVLPRVVGSAGPITSVGGLRLLPSSVPVSAVLGDSHAALFAHAGWRAGQVKATYGTGSSVMGLTDKSSAGSAGLCRTIAWDIGEPRFALEGNIRSSGATLTWLARLFGTQPGELAAGAAASSDGVHLVPAFSGLGAPWWDDAAVAVMDGMSFGTTPEQLARAALESIAFQIEDVVAEIEREAGPVETVLADGGPTSNNTLMQLQADTSGRRVARARARDLSALGAAHAAGLSAGVWTWDDLENLPRDREPFAPREHVDSRQGRLAGWHQAVARARLARTN
jgi:glycerol kinase